MYMVWSSLYYGGKYNFFISCDLEDDSSVRSVFGLNCCDVRVEFTHTIDKYRLKSRQF